MPPGAETQRSCAPCKGEAGVGEPDNYVHTGPWELSPGTPERAVVSLGLTKQSESVVAVENVDIHNSKGVGRAGVHFIELINVLESCIEP
jgi:hypothetical protein